MERLNALGMELLGYKQELMNESYSELVRKSLRLAVDQMVTNRIIDAGTYDVINDDSVSLDDFRAYLLSKKTFLKTDEEIFLEFEEIRKQFSSLFQREDIKTESVVKKDVILAIKSFVIDESFVLEYFRVDEVELFKLMKRKGFVEKFAVLRLRSIFESFMEEIEESEWIRTDISLVYFDKDHSYYAIDLFFEIPVEELEDVEKQKEAASFVEDVVSSSVVYYQERMKP